MESKVYNMIQHVLDSKHDWESLKDCNSVIENALTHDYVMQCTGVSLRDPDVEKIKGIWSTRPGDGTFAWCCGSPILYAEAHFNVGHPAIVRLQETVDLLATYA